MSSVEQPSRHRLSATSSRLSASLLGRVSPRSSRLSGLVRVIVAVAGAGAALHGQPASGQTGIGVGASAGSLGFGADAVFPVAEWISVRGGASLRGIEVDLTGRFTERIGLEEGLTATLTVPGGSFRIGADLDLGLARIGAGLLFWSESPKVEVATRPDVSFGIGGVQYNGEQVTSMTGTLEGSGRAYFALLGFGSPSGHGLGLFADLGVIVRSGVALRMSATGRDEVIGTEDFEDDLAREAQDIEEGLGSFIDYWPLVVLGVRYGL